MHVEFLLEEESAAEAIKLLLPKIIGDRATYRLHSFQGKHDLLQKLPHLLRGYNRWIPNDYRIVVLLDRDNDDCRNLKQKMETIAKDASMVTLTTSGKVSSFHVLNRIAIEELEAWFLGDVQAIRKVFPRVPSNLARKRGLTDPDAIKGGTWETLQRVLQKAGYFPTGMPKIDTARRIAAEMNPDCNRSRSFRCFRDTLIRVVPQDRFELSS